MSNWKVVVIEDEKPAARRLERMLEKLGLSVQQVLHAVEESVNWFYNNPHPDLVFLDVQLSDGLSFEIFEEIPLKSAVIFTTAYDEYALKAFKLNSVDYLLKPIDPDELKRAIEKFELHFRSGTGKIELDQIKKLLRPDKPAFKKRFTIRIGQHLKMVPVERINCFYSENKATNISTADGRDYILEESLDQLEPILLPERFFRVSRKYIVNIDAITDIIAYSNSRLKLQIDGLKGHEIVVSRERVRDFKDWIS